MNSAVPKQSNIVEIENQFVLRMPTIKSENGLLKPHPATAALRQALAEAKTREDSIEDPLKDRLSIELNPESRKGRVKFDNEIFEARLVDLPCVIESLKTTDKKIFYKSADICQMLVCKANNDTFSNSEDEKDKEKNQADYQLKKYQWPHGLAPPLKNVRRKRFRKCAKKKFIDYAEIEREVKQLFRADREAAKIDYEVCMVEADPDDDNDESKNVEARDYDSYDENGYKDKSMTEGFKSKSMIEDTNMSDTNYDTSSMPAHKIKLPDDSSNVNLVEESNDASNLDASSNRTSFKNIFVKEVLGDLSSSDENADEDDDEEEDEENETKSKSIASRLFGADDDSISNFEDAKTDQNNYEESDVDKTKMDEDDVSLMSPPQNDPKSEIASKLNNLMEELNKIQEERRRKEIEIEPINNPVLKNYLTSKLNSLIEEENKKHIQVEELKKLLE
ncbi:transcription initiation factor TFIID subunit 7 [Brachionus plicatilis]|uniref:Transcription initiation factor TFIID subunit 7 n=1 Tax=Brachionus plicatilis TaxID=10195 RepID=A0A3M7RIX3_BRAPC|nr:transcription initiation factor TFIID subunit 7 [Brachionus plicatilis]